MANDKTRKKAQGEHEQTLVQKQHSPEGMQVRGAKSFAEGVEVSPENLPFLYTKHNHITFKALPMLSERSLSRNLCVIVLSNQAQGFPVCGIIQRMTLPFETG
jgi:hypothetical protein